MVGVFPVLRFFAAASWCSEVSIAAIAIACKDASEYWFVIAGACTAVCGCRTNQQKILGLQNEGSNSSRVRHELRQI